jgi:hypothetical protein
MCLGKEEPRTGRIFEKNGEQSYIAARIMLKLCNHQFPWGGESDDQYGGSSQLHRLSEELPRALYSQQSRAKHARLFVALAYLSRA